MGAEPSTRLEGRIPGGWLPISHAEAVKGHPGLELVALCDTDEQRRSRFGELYNVQQMYSDYNKLLEEVKPEFVCIATRTEGRTDIIRRAIENGAKAIYFEKPLSRSVNEADSILQFAIKNNVKLGFGVNRRYHGMYRKAKEMVQSGIIGDVVEIIVEHDASKLLWAHPHSLDLILFFGGTTDLDFAQATCEFSEGYKPVNKKLVDDDPMVSNAFFRFKNGLKASLNCAGGLNTRIAGTKGILTVYSDGYYIHVTKEGTALPYYYTEAITEQPVIDKSATENVINELVAAVTENGKMPVTPQEIFTNSLMASGIVYSHLEGGRRVSVNEIPYDMVITGKSGNFYA